MKNFLPLRGTRMMFALVALMVASSTGCGFLAVMLYPGRMSKPEFAELKGKKVAVLCVGSQGWETPDESTARLAKLIETDLKVGLKKEITFVEQQKIADWQDRNNWNGVDVEVIGKGVKADLVMLVDVKRMTFKENTGLYEGKASSTITIYDMSKKGHDQEVFRKEVPTYVYPNNSNITTAEMTKPDFQRTYLTRYAHQLAKYFYSYDMNEDFAAESGNP